MAIKFTIKGNEKTPEYQDALRLKELLEADLVALKISGEILIISNATLFGQEVKDVDLIVLGKFEKFAVKGINTEAITYENHSRQHSDKLQRKKRDVYVNDFCFVIETKRHPIESIKMDGQTLLVKYRKHWHDVTTQSEGQKYSLKNFFDDRMNSSPYICNFIWFRNIEWSALKELISENGKVFKHNYLPSSFNYRFLFQLACIQKKPFIPFDNRTGGLKYYSSYSSFPRKGYDFLEIQKAFDLFTRIKKVTGKLTRKKIQKITKTLLKNQKYAKALGNMLVVIAGRAGTGKTIKLLNISYDLASQRGDRCLILTYNHALVSDIKRILALSEVPDGVDTHTVQISTLHKFFFELLQGFGIVKGRYVPDFLTKYKNYVKELHSYILEGLIDANDIQELMVNRHEQVAWDFVLIDESQDWQEEEKDVIFAIFGKENIIVADGVDQMVRSANRCEWTKGLKKEGRTSIVENINSSKYWKQTETKSLRQKTGLVDFLNAFADKLDVNWNVERSEELVGGKVIITTRAYEKSFHESQVEYLLNQENTHFEMMFLVPPTLVLRDYKPDEEKREFALLQEFSDNGIKLWDGTSKDLRTNYPVELNQHRLFQYDSCRGLEGWTVVCLDFDDFIKYKLETYTEDENALNGFNEMKTFEERRQEFVYLWALIPMTRAVDRLIINIRDKESEICKTLEEIYNERPDLIDWID